MIIRIYDYQEHLLSLHLIQETILATISVTLINSISYLSKYLYQSYINQILINYFYILEYLISSSSNGILFHYIINKHIFHNCCFCCI